MVASLNRQTFRTNRVLDFFSRKELVTQTGHPERDWPLVVAKELIDNALDACEEAGTPPEVSVCVDSRGITVCRELQRSTGSSPFFLSCRTAGRWLDVRHDRAARWLKLLVEDEVLQLFAAGGIGTMMASRYRYVPQVDW